LAALELLDALAAAFFLGAVRALEVAALVRLARFLVEAGLALEARLLT
jgi:hypothetical protein